MARARHADSRLADAALSYARHGWPVLPLHTPQGEGCSCRAPACGSPGKHPRTRHGLHQATTDLDQVQTWWSRWPQANVGVATGPASGLLVLDIDLPDGPDSLDRLEAAHALLPATCEQRTGSGGRQLLFVHPKNSVGNRAAVVPGVDVRGEGGYVVVPPSLHVSGERYMWVGRRSPARPPNWLVSLLDRRLECTAITRSCIPAADGTRIERYAAVAMQSEMAGLAAAVEGTRNATLNRAAFSLGQLVAVGLLDRDTVETELERVALDVGLLPAEARRTIASGLTAGLDRPRAFQDSPASRGQEGTGPVLAAPVRRIGPRRR